MNSMQRTFTAGLAKKPLALIIVLMGMAMNAISQDVIKEINNGWAKDCIIKPYMTDKFVVLSRFEASPSLMIVDTAGTTVSVIPLTHSQNAVRDITDFDVKNDTIYICGYYDMDTTWFAAVISFDGDTCHYDYFDLDYFKEVNRIRFMDYDYGKPRILVAGVETSGEAMITMLYPGALVYLADSFIITDSTYTLHHVIDDMIVTSQYIVASSHSGTVLKLFPSFGRLWFIDRPQSGELLTTSQIRYANTAYHTRSEVRLAKQDENWFFVAGTSANTSLKDTAWAFVSRYYLLQHYNTTHLKLASGAVDIAYNPLGHNVNLIISTPAPSTLPFFPSSKYYKEVYTMNMYLNAYMSFVLGREYSGYRLQSTAAFPSSVSRFAVVGITSPSSNPTLFTFKSTATVGACASFKQVPSESQFFQEQVNLHDFVDVIRYIPIKSQLTLIMDKKTTFTTLCQ